MEQKKTTVFEAAIGLSALSILSKLLGIAREQVIAWRLEASAEVDAYVATLLVPQLLAALVGGAIGAAFLPVLTKEREAGRGDSLVATAFQMTLLLGAVGMAVVLIFAPVIVKGLVGNFSLEQQQLAVILLRIMAGGALLLGVTAFLTLYFNSQKEFMLPALALNGVIVLGLMTLGESVRHLAWSTLAGMLLPVVIMLIVLTSRRAPPVLAPRMTDPAFLQACKLSAPTI